MTATLSGFRDKTESDVTVGLGEARTVDFRLSSPTVTETITIVGESPVIDTTRAGTASNVKARGDREPADDFAQHHRHRPNVAVFQRVEHRTAVIRSSASPAATTATTTSRSTAP